MKYFLFSGLVLIYFLNLNFSYKNNSRQESCSDCHNDLLEYKTLHPVMKEGCDICHQPKGGEHPNEGGFSLTESVPALCFECHEKFSKKNLHYPVGKGACLSCHSPHGSEYSAMLITPAGKLCAKCHDVGVPKNNTVHYPYAEGSCSDCHNAHQSDNTALIKLPVPALCFECHENKESMKGIQSLHPPYKEDCTICHNPHSSENAKLLTEKIPDLCFNCHEKSDGKYLHSPVKNGKCISCHAPHASTRESLLIANNKKLCLKCHSKTYRTDSTLVQNIGQLISKSKYVHAAIEINGCATCHSGHSTGRPAMLLNNFPAGFYAPAKPKNFALCFDCHDGAILEKDVAASGTNFRNGSKNLHYVHINGTRGRSCRVCHNVHASQNEHLIRENVTYGKWTMKLNYKVSENGGSCTPGCHGKQKYDRNFVK